MRGPVDLCGFALIYKKGGGFMLIYVDSWNQRRELKGDLEVTHFQVKIRVSSSKTSLIKSLVLSRRPIVNQKFVSN